MPPDTTSLVRRIGEALSAAGDVLRRFDRGTVNEQKKAGGDPVTEADLAIDSMLRHCLLADGEGWLSEETADDSSQLDRRLVWIVDPLDGTREFIDGFPEFCTSVAAVVDGIPVAGGIVNTAAGIEVIGGHDLGVVCDGKPPTSPVLPHSAESRCWPADLSSAAACGRSLSPKESSWSPWARLRTN